MNRNSGRKSPGGDKGRGSDRNKNTASRAGRAAERGGTKGKSSAPDKPTGKKTSPSVAKNFDKPFAGKKSGGKATGFATNKTDKRVGAKGNFNPEKSFNDKKSSGRTFFGADKPAARGKSSYKDYASKKTNRNVEDYGFDGVPEKAFGHDDFYGFDMGNLSESRNIGKNKRDDLDSSKKLGSKYQKRRDSLEKNTSKSQKEVGGQAGIRLNKFIANSGLCSRREADVMIQNGVVTVNGKIMDELGYRVQPGDEVKFDGRTIIPEKPVYLLLNKPKDYITTAEDPQGRKTVMSLIQGACKERVFPVGRLDRNTTGLLLFTNDGEMADKLMHPRKKIKKIYMVELDKNLRTEDLKQLREGITLEDGPIKPDAVEYADGPKIDKKVVGVEIHSGRNRIVRRMFEHFGYKVVKLDRVYLAGLTKKNLPRGEYRMLEPKEVNMLKML